VRQSGGADRSWDCPTERQIQVCAAAGDTILDMAQATKLTKSEIERRRAAAERARGMLGHDPSRSFSDELIAERRAEARAEDHEDEARRRSGGR
jgi:hypothetical protein